MGLDNKGEKVEALIKREFSVVDNLNVMSCKAIFPKSSMLRFLFVFCPEGLLATLSDFDVRGQGFVF